MSDNYNFMNDPIGYIFSSDKRTGALSYDELQMRRKLAMALATRNRRFPQTIGEGLTYLGESLGERWDMQDLAKAEAEQKSRDLKFQQGGGATTPSPAAAPAAAPTALSALDDDQTEPARPAVAAPTTTEQAPSVIPPLPQGRTATPPNAPKAPRVQLASLAPINQNMDVNELTQRLARNESGGSSDPYNLIGQQSRRGDYPYGKYQVMGVNIAPWTKQHYGEELTPEQFLTNKDAQEAVAKGQGGLYLNKYGPEGAAAAWFAGEKGMNDPNRKDTLGTHVSEYVRRFSRPLPANRDDLALASLQSPSPAGAGAEAGALGAGVGVLGQAPAPQRVQLAQAQPSVIPPPTQPQQRIQQAPKLPAYERAMGGQTLDAPALAPRPEAPGVEERRLRAGAADQMLSPGMRESAAAQAKILEEERKARDLQNMKDYELKRNEQTSRTGEAIKFELGTAERVATQMKTARELITPDKDRSNAINALPAGMAAIRNARNALDSGVFSGLGADQKVAGSKFLELLGFPQDPRVPNSESYLAFLKPLVGSARNMISGSANVSDADIKNAEQAAGANLQLTETSMRRILDSLERIQLGVALDHQNRVGEAANAFPEVSDRIARLNSLNMENIVPRGAIQELLSNPTPEAIREFNSDFKTPGLAERIIQSRTPQVRR